jgi:hypothetical protein
VPETVEDGDSPQQSIDTGEPGAEDADVIGCSRSRLTCAATGPEVVYKSYMDLYVHLDRTLWQAITFVQAVIGVGFVFVVGARDQTRLLGPIRDAILAVGFFVVALLITLGNRSIARIREDTRMLVIKADAIEAHLMSSLPRNNANPAMPDFWFFRVRRERMERAATQTSFWSWLSSALRAQPASATSASATWDYFYVLRGFIVVALLLSMAFCALFAYDVLPACPNTFLWSCR